MELVIACDNYKTIFMTVGEIGTFDELILIFIFVVSVDIILIEYKGGHFSWWVQREILIRQVVNDIFRKTLTVHKMTVSMILNKNDTWIRTYGSIANMKPYFIDVFF